MFKVVSIMLLFTVLVVSFQNCAPGFNSVGNYTSSSLTADIDPAALSAFESTLRPTLQNNCIACHGSFQQPAFASPDISQAYFTIFANSLVDFSNPGESRFVQKIRIGHNNISQTVADELEQKIADWDETRNSAVPTPAPGPAPGPPIDGLEATFSSIHENILVPKCMNCHNSTSSRSEDYTDYDSTTATGGIVPGDAFNSPLYLECVTGNMPKNASQTLSFGELEAIRDWINAGAPNN